MIDPNTIIEAQRSWRAAAEAGGDTAHRATAVALVGMRDAVVVLLENLAGFGYPEVPGLVAPSPGLDDRLRGLETAAGGAVPLVLVEFWRTVGGISLVDLNNYSHVGFWRSRSILGPSGCCDGVHVEALDADWAWLEVQDSPQAAPYFLDLAPDLYHKDDSSGGSSYGVRVGDGWLAPWRNFEWAGPRRPVSAPPDTCDFLGYLRTAILECAGFPALLGVPMFEPVRQRLLSQVPGF